MLAFFFPGQGSQSPGMGRSIADAYSAARQVFEEADDALGTSLSKTIFEGTEDELKRTEVTQPAILTTSIATLRAIQSERPDLEPAFAAGHSLGEWSALVAVGALEFADAVRLVRSRGRFMQDAVPVGEGTMAAVIGLEIDAVEGACRRAATETSSVVAPANMNAPEQTVISGATAAVRRASEQCQAEGAKRVMPLPVSAPFHCALMQPAADRLAEALAEVEVRALRAPVIGNVEASPYRDAERVRDLLVRQVTSPVRWVESTRRAIDGGASSAVEIGPGKVLAGLARRIDRRLAMHTTEDLDALRETLAAL